jgi:hypothetical protein
LCCGSARVLGFAPIISAVANSGCAPRPSIVTTSLPVPQHQHHASTGTTTSIWRLLWRICTSWWPGTRKCLSKFVHPSRYLAIDNSQGRLASRRETCTEPTARISSTDPGRITTYSRTQCCPAPHPSGCIPQAEQGPMVQHPQRHQRNSSTIHYLCHAIVWCQVRSIFIPSVEDRICCLQPNRSRTICLYSPSKLDWRYTR